jgi:ABC-2 type transport system permease protein
LDVLRGLLKLTWLEIKIFAREPLGLVGSLLIPVLVFVVIGRAIGPVNPTSSSAAFAAIDLPVFAALMIAMSAVLSLMTIIAIYREGGILKRLRATPLHSTTILTAHVVVKLLMSAATLALLFLAGRRFYHVTPGVPVVSFTLALLFATSSILSLGFVLASVVPTARFAQPIGAAILYPMVALSGLFFPVAALPPMLRVIARLVPLTYAVSLLKGIWTGETWSAHAGDVAALIVVALVGIALSARFFRWE